MTKTQKPPVGPNKPRTATVELIMGRFNYLPKSTIFKDQNSPFFTCFFPNLITLSYFSLRTPFLSHSHDLTFTFVVALTLTSPPPPLSLSRSHSHSPDLSPLSSRSLDLSPPRSHSLDLSPLPSLSYSQSHLRCRFVRLIWVFS